MRGPRSGDRQTSSRAIAESCVLRGEAGVGKTALLEYLAARGVANAASRAPRASSPRWSFRSPACISSARRCWIASGICRTRRATRSATAFGLSSGESPDRFLVGLAALTLLSDVAEERPLLCLVDDAQWLDRASAQALAFVARRLRAEAVALVFAEREPSKELAGLAELAVDGLADEDARALLESVITGPLDERVRDRIVAETRGNPLALMELPHGLTHAELAGGFGLSPASALSGQIEESFRRRLTPLPPASRELLLVAAAEPVGDPVTVWHAAELLGVGAQARRTGVGAGTDRVRRAGAVPSPARALGRLPVGIAGGPPAGAPRPRRGDRSGDRPRPPSVASRARDPGARRERSPPSWSESAGRAQARGGLAAAAAFLRRAADLTPAPEPRARRALAAAQCSHEAGAPDAALELLAMAEAGPLDELQRARAELLRAQIRFAVDRGRDAPPLLLAAAKRLETLDAKLSRETYLDAFSAALFAGRLAQGAGVREVAEAVLAADWGESDAGSCRARAICSSRAWRC